MMHIKHKTHQSLSLHPSQNWEIADTKNKNNSTTFEVITNENMTV